MFAERHWGRGYATEAAGAVLRLGVRSCGARGSLFADQRFESRPRPGSCTASASHRAPSSTTSIRITRRPTTRPRSGRPPPGSGNGAVPDFRIETARLVLRDWREGDAEAFFDGHQHPAVMRWLGGVMDADGRQALLDRVARCRAGARTLLLDRRAQGRGRDRRQVLGFCGLKRADAPGSSVTGEMEVGWRLREDAWGQGYAKEAAHAALDAAFDRFGADEVVAITVIENAASWGLMKRLGMTAARRSRLSPTRASNRRCAIRSSVRSTARAAAEPVIAAGPRPAPLFVATDPDRQLPAVPRPADGRADGAAPARRRAQRVEQRDAGLPGAAARRVRLCPPASAGLSLAMQARVHLALLAAGRADPADRISPTCRRLPRGARCCGCRCCFSPRSARCSSRCRRRRR